jgi:hypothetical protein
MNFTWIRVVFGLSAVYDFVLGLGFLFAAGPIFARFGVTPPNHPGYVQFPALLLVVFGVLFVRIAMDPAGRREWMLYGIGLKLAYAGTVFTHQVGGGIPAMWLPFAWADVAFAALFAAAWAATGRARRGN